MTRKELIDRVTELEGLRKPISRAQVSEVTRHVCAELFVLPVHERMGICRDAHKSREASRRKALRK